MQEGDDKITWLFQGQENVFARSVLCDEAISKFMSFACLSGDCFDKNRLATTYRRFVKRLWNNHKQNHPRKKYDFVIV